MGGEEIVDDVRAVLVGYGANPGHACEGQRADELAQRQFKVEVVEFGSSFIAVEERIERLSVLVDDSGPQSPGCVAILGLVFGTGRPE